MLDQLISVIGSGTMGSGIAQLAATAGHSVVLYDLHEVSIEKAKAGLDKILNRLVEKGRLTDVDRIAIFGRIHFTTNLEAVKDSSMVIEAIVENLDIKKKVFKNIEDLVSANCILATNTSSLSVTSIASACADASRVIGVHFFNPAPLMKLVEIVPAVQTSDEVYVRAEGLISSWGKITVKAKDTPGFIVNRVARPFYGEALRIYEEGIADIPTIDWAMTTIAGFRMGPFTLMDYIGNDVNYTVTETVFHAFYFDPRYKPAFAQKRLSEAGYWGRKTGRGYYKYGEGAINPLPNIDEDEGQIIVDRIVIMLINEAADALFWKIATAEDIDNAMTKGVNYPKGLLAWADEKGITSCVKQLDELYKHYGEDRYRCSPLLRTMADNNQTFF